MKSIALLLLLIGVILITLGISKNNTDACPTKIETRTVSGNYLSNVLESPDNYKSIFEDRVIGIPDSLNTYKVTDNEYDNQSNIHNMF
jgi:cell division protein FtsN